MADIEELSDWLSHAEQWVVEAHASLRALMLGGAAAGGRPQVSDGTRVGIVVQSLLERWGIRPTVNDPFDLEAIAEHIENVQLLEDLVEEVIGGAGCGPGNAGPARPPVGQDARRFLAEVRADLSRERLDGVRERALSEINALRGSVVRANSVASVLTPAESRWLRALGEIITDGQFDPIHYRIALHLGIAKGTSENLTRRLRESKLVGPPPKTKDEHLGLTELGWHVWKLLPPTGGLSPGSVPAL